MLILEKIKNKIENLSFTKKVYPVFIKHLKKASDDEKAIFIIKNTDTTLIIKIIIENKLYIFNKERYEDMKIEEYTITPNLMNEIDNVHKTMLKDLILDFKVNGQLVTSSHIVEFFSTNIKNFFLFYNLKRKDLHTIYEVILIKHQHFYTTSMPKITLNATQNRWID